MSKPDPKMLDLLVCPVSGGPLEWQDGEEDKPGEDWLISKAANLKFPVRDGIPILLESEAKPIQS